MPKAPGTGRSPRRPAVTRSNQRGASAQQRLAGTDDPVSRPAKKSELVARTIAHELFTRQVKPGSLIDVEDDLVRRLGVSRGSLREGLRMLEVLGVVESRLGRSGGIAVMQPTPEHFARILTFYLQSVGCTYGELINVYAEVWPIILRLVATDASEAALDRLVRKMEQLDELPIHEQVRLTPSINLIYSDMVANPMWALLARCFHLVISRHLEALLVPEAEWPNVVKTVRRIAAAVIARDPARAEKLGRAQVQAWLTIAATSHRELWDTPIVWATGDELSSDD